MQFQICLRHRFSARNALAVLAQTTLRLVGSCFFRSLHSSWRTVLLLRRLRRLRWCWKLPVLPHFFLLLLLLLLLVYLLLPLRGIASGLF